MKTYNQMGWLLSPQGCQGYVIICSSCTESSFVVTSSHSSGGLYVWENLGVLHAANAETKQEK